MSQLRDSRRFTVNFCFCNKLKRVFFGELCDLNAEVTRLWGKPLKPGIRTDVISKPLALLRQSKHTSNDNDTAELFWLTFLEKGGRKLVASAQG